MLLKSEFFWYNAALVFKGDIKMAATRRFLQWFCFFQMVIFAGVSLRYLFYVPTPNTLAGISFLIMAYIGQAFFIIGLFVFLPCYIMSFIIRHNNFIRWLPLGLASLLLVILVTDTFVMALYHFHINRPILGMIFSSAVTEIFVFSTVMYFQIALLIAVLVTFQFFVWKYAQKKSTQVLLSKWTATKLSVSFFIILLSQSMWYAYADTVGQVDITVQGRTLPLYQRVTAHTLFTELGVKENPHYKLHKATSGLFNYPKKELSYQVPAKKLNVLFILIDSWNYQYLNEEITPNVFSFSKNSSQFLNHFSNSNSTRNSIFTLFYSIPGTYWEAAVNEGKRSVIIDAFYKNGYDMGIFASAKITSPDFNRTVFYGLPNLRTSSPGATPDERDQSITNEFTQFVQKRNADKPFFGFLFYDSAHSYSFPPNYPKKWLPISEHPNYLTQSPEKDPIPLQNRYKNALNFVDIEVGKVLAELEKSKLLDNTVVIITGDHGEEFNESKMGLFGHGSNFFQYQTKVPLIVHWPGKTPKVYSHINAHVDFAPTLLPELLGTKNSVRDYSIGKSLFEEKDSDFILMNDFFDMAVREKNVTRVIYEYGNINTFDNNTYQLIPNAPQTSQAVLDAFKIRGEYFK